MIEDRAVGKSDTGRFPAVGIDLDITNYINSLTPEQLNLVKGILKFKSIRRYNWQKTIEQYLHSAAQDPGVGPLVERVLEQIPLLESLEIKYGNLDPYF